MSDQLAIALVTVFGGGICACGVAWIKETGRQRTTKLRLAAERRAQNAERPHVIYEQTGLRPRGAGPIPQRIEHLESDVAALKETDVKLRWEVNDIILHQARDMAGLLRSVEDLQRHHKQSRLEALYDLLALVLSASLVQYLAGLPGAAVPWLMAVAVLYGGLALYRLLVLS